MRPWHHTAMVEAPEVPLYLMGAEELRHLEGMGIAPLVPVAAKGVTAAISALLKMNHPYGTCAPTAPDAESFLHCWTHDIGNNFLPYWKGAPTAKQPGTQGWDFAVCHGATNGRVPSSGCQLPCDCTTRGCVCAPAGAVTGLRDGTFLDAQGRNLGPAVMKLTPLSSVKAAAQTAEQAAAAVTGGGTTSMLPLLGIGLAAAFLLL